MLQPTPNPSRVAAAAHGAKRTRQPRRCSTMHHAQGYKEGQARYAFISYHPVCVILARRRSRLRSAFGSRGAWAGESDLRRRCVGLGVGASSASLLPSPAPHGLHTVSPPPATPSRRFLLPFSRAFAAFPARACSFRLSGACAFRLSDACAFLFSVVVWCNNAFCAAPVGLLSKTALALSSARSTMRCCYVRYGAAAALLPLALPPPLLLPPSNSNFLVASRCR